MTQAAVYALAEHFWLVAGLFALGTIAGAALVGGVRFASWSDRRARQMAEAVLRSDETKRLVVELASVAFAPIREEIALLRGRETERDKSTTAAHRRIDEVERRVNERLDQFDKRCFDTHRRSAA